MDIAIEKIVEHGGVTPAYARMLKARSRKPSLALALRLFDATGVKIGPLEGKTARDIEAFRKLPQAD